MKKSSLVAIAIAAMAMFSFALAACSAGGAASSVSSAGTAGSGPVEQLSASVVKVSLDGSDNALDARVTVNAGEPYVVASNLESGEAETVLKYPEGDMSDYAYEGYSVGSMEVSAGTYDVTVKPDGAKGTIYILSYPAGDLDPANAESEELFNQVEEFAAGVA